MNDYIKIIVSLLLVVFLTGTIPLSAEVFVNWKGGYYVEYPEDWYQVPYSTVNYFLTNQKVSIMEFEYEAVFSPKTDQPFFVEPYMFLSHQPGDPPTDVQIDSVLEEISQAYNSKYIRASIWPGEKKFGLGKPIYDESLKVLLVKTRVTSDKIDKILLEIWKFYEKGVAIFLCYAPKEKYNEAKPIFLEIVGTFSTNDLERAAPKEDIQVVDLSARETEKYDESDFPEPGQDKSNSIGMSQTWLILTPGFIFMLIVVFIVAKKRKSKLRKE